MLPLLSRFVGFDLDQPKNAFVICINEKTGIKGMGDRLAVLCVVSFHCRDFPRIKTWIFLDQEMGGREKLVKRKVLPLLQPEYIVPRERVMRDVLRFTCQFNGILTTLVAQKIKAFYDREIG